MSTNVSKVLWCGIYVDSIRRVNKTDDLRWLDVCQHMLYELFSCLPVSSVKSSTVHDGVLCHCLSAASADCQLPPAIHTMTLAFDVWPFVPMAWNLLLDSLCDPLCSFNDFCHDLEPFLSLLAYTVH